MAKWYTCLPAGRRARIKMFFVYILQSLKTGEFYKGLTDNISRRIDQHFIGKSNWAKGKLPIKLVHVEICQTRQEARTTEKFFKSGYGREVVKELAN
ncbi:MAG TPA: GIY-YIG nuclease family protein [Candidatus Saccharimonadales bacterium]|nr:GIY-YIG nuclease family protein [Candidatus Saccharimonadales bacterium]